MVLEQFLPDSRRELWSPLGEAALPSSSALTQSADHPEGPKSRHEYNSSYKRFSLELLIVKSMVALIVRVSAPSEV